ncbi:MAG: hypothetical protein IJ189_04515 [Clostridia bacterium]|nr:hypothetical protein [Clostridia bacterium]
MNNIRKITGLIPALVLWLMFSVLLWGFVFTKITDAPAQNKIVLFVDAAVPGEAALAQALEEGRGEHIRMVQVHPFTYAMLDGGPLEQADLYIVPASHVETYQEWFRPLPQALEERDDLLFWKGRAWGVRVYDANGGRGAAEAYIDYETRGAEREDYYLIFGARSLHVLTNENAVDDEAVFTARRLLNLR